MILFERRFAALEQTANRAYLTVAVVALVFGGIGSAILLQSHAATPVAAAETETGTITGPARITSDTTASGGKAVIFGAATSTGSCPVYPSFPDASCTGVPSGMSLTVISGDYTINTAGTYSGLDVAGSVTINAANVTLKNTRIRCTNVPDTCLILGGGSDTVSNVEVGGGSDGITDGQAIGVYSGQSNANNVLNQLNVHNTSDGLRTDGGTTVQNSYIHNLNSCCGIHSDGSQSTGFSNMIFRHNTIEGGDNDALFFKTETGNPEISNVTIDQNHLIGTTNVGGMTSYGIGVDAGATIINVTNNVFTKPFQAGPVNSSFNWTTFSGNKYDDGTPVAP